MRNQRQSIALIFLVAICLVGPYIFPQESSSPQGEESKKGKEGKKSEERLAGHSGRSPNNDEK